MNPARPAPFRAVEAVSLGAYAVLVAWLTAHHAPWADEAQAWLIARDSSFSDIFLKRLHYEGTPGLWHLLLWAFTRLHLSYAGMHWATAAIATVTMGIFLAYAPFPRPIRAAFPFVYAFAFQTAIVARSYSLVPLLVFLACILIAGSRERPVCFALVAGLLANLALVAGDISIGLVLVYLWRWKVAPRAQHAPRIPGRPAPPPFHWIAAAALLLLLWGAAFFTAIPAPDVTFGRGPDLAAKPAIAKLFSTLTGVPIAPKPPSPAPAIAPDKPTGMNSVESRIWDITRDPAHKTKAGVLLNTALSLLSLLFYLVSSSNLLAASFYVLLLLWLLERHCLVALVPFGLAAVTAYLLGFNEHHASMLFSTLLAVLWIGCSLPAPAHNTGWTSRLFQIALVLVVLEQVAWTAVAAHQDRTMPFDASRQVVRFLEDQVQPQPIAGFTQESISVEPYFDHRVYFNQNTTYWPWKASADPDEKLEQVVAGKPAYILVGEVSLGPATWSNQLFMRVQTGSLEGVTGVSPSQFLVRHGYRQTHLFCGEQPGQFAYSHKHCDSIFQPSTELPSPAR